MEAEDSSLIRLGGRQCIELSWRKMKFKRQMWHSCKRYYSLLISSCWILHISLIKLVLEQRANRRFCDVVVEGPIEGSWLCCRTIPFLEEMVARILLPYVGSNTR